MLSLTDFYRIRESTLFNPATQTPLQHTTLNILTTSESSNDYLTRAEKHKHKLRSFDKKYPFHRLMTYENKKNFDPYSIVNEEDDALKEINILCKNAKIAAIRDKQLDERKYMENMYKKKEERLDFMMELERLKEIKFKEEKEKNLKKLNLDSQQVLIDQILDNERERLKKREQIEKDKHQMKMQLEKLEEEYDKVAKKYEREKRVLQLQIDDRTAEIKNLNQELEQLEQENKSLKDKIPFDEKKAFELNVLLESNLKDLRKKLEQSQVERLTLEDQNNTYVKSMKDKNVLIANLEKQIAEMKMNYNQGGVNQPLAGNIIKKITGGIK